MRARRGLALCGAVILLAAGMGLGRYATLRQGAVVRASVSGAGLEALDVRPAEGTNEKTGADAGGAVIDINRAGTDELAELPGIGPALAGRIVAHRGQNGDFESIEEIMAVRGIGQAVFAKIKDYIGVTEAP